jgi:toxin-antitoxin system PIN domain toxin
MLFPDVNVLVGAQRNDISPHSQTMRAWLDGALDGHESVGICEPVMASMARIVTNGKVFEHPSTPAQALDFADAVLGAPGVVVVRPGGRHWAIFGDLVREQRLRANAVPDAYLAAIALEVGATMVTADRGFARFGVKTYDPTA